MIKLIREGAKRYPWILKVIILLIAVTFVVGMGWFGFEQSRQPNAVALIGPYKVSREEFRRAYNNMYRVYREQLKQEDVDEETLKQMVIGGLVDSKAWTLTADRLELDVSDQELAQTITDRKEFQADGQFNPQLYQRLLASIHISPKEYESQQTMDLKAKKAQLIVQDVAALTPEEMKEVEDLTTRQSAGKDAPEEVEKIRERIRLQLLFQKKQRALRAFQAAMRQEAQVEIREEFL